MKCRLLNSVGIQYNDFNYEQFVLPCRNQEYLEDLKKSIAEKQAKENEFFQASVRSTSVLNSIKLTIMDLIHKLEEVATSGSIEIESNENSSNNALLQAITIVALNSNFA